MEKIRPVVWEIYIPQSRQPAGTRFDKFLVMGNAIWGKLGNYHDIAQLYV